MKKGGKINPSILAIIAAKNEENGIGPTLSELNTILYQPLLLVVNGRSSDKTVKIAQSLGAEVLEQTHHGKGDAIAVAMDYANQFNFEYMILIDADFTYPAEYLPRMLKLLEKNQHVGMVCGNRFNGHFNLGNFHNILYTGNRLLAFIHNFFNGVQLRDPLTGLRVIRGKILKNWIPKSKGFDIEVELNHHVERAGYGIVEIPIHYRPRLGEKKLKIKDGFTIFKRIFSEMFA